MTDEMKLGLVFMLIVLVASINIMIGMNLSTNSTAAEFGVRVVAHSDDDFDQLVKHVTLQTLQSFIAQSGGITLEFLAGHLNELHTFITDTFESIAVTTNVQTSVNYHYLPENGYQKSLVIQLGEANGENLFCFMNSTSCDVNSSVNSRQLEDTENLRGNLDNVSRRWLGNVSRIFGNLFRNDETATAEEIKLLSEGGFDWFLFDDER